MLLVGGKTETGHVLHVIVGAESEFHMDLHGNTMIDITPMLAAMGNVKELKLMITRCKSEVSTSQLMDHADIPHLTSLKVSDPSGKPTAVVQDGPDLDMILNHKAQQPRGSKAKVKEQPAPVPDPPSGLCSYCGQTKPLVDIGTIKICQECAIIELMRKQTKGA